MTIPLSIIKKRLHKFTIACLDLAEEIIKFSPQSTNESVLCYCVGNLILKWRSIFPKDHLDFCYEIEEYVDDLKDVHLAFCKINFWKKSNNICRQKLPFPKTSQFINYFDSFMIDLFETFGLSRYEETINMNVLFEMLKQLVHFHSSMKQMIENKNQEIALVKYIQNDQMVIEIKSSELNPHTSNIMKVEKTQMNIDL